MGYKFLYGFRQSFIVGFLQMIIKMQTFVKKPGKIVFFVFGGTI